MKGLPLFAVAATLLSSSSSCVEGLHLHERRDGPPRVVGMPIQRKTVKNPVTRDRLRRRDETVQVTLDNEETLYIANGTLGTPSQSFRLLLDTGSSDLWVNSATSTFCEEKSKPCAASGTYSANDSSTYAYIASDFNITYEDGSGASGDYATDTFTIGGSTLAKLQFGIGYTSTSEEAVLGIGYPAIEAQVGTAGKASYNNLPAQMVVDGLIQSNAYSLWLNDLQASTGSILFGGVDTAQYTGTLETLPIQKEDGVYADFLITLTAISLGSVVIAKDQAVAVLLDSGTSLTYLPDAMTEAIYEQVGAEYDSTEGAAYVPCSLSTNTTSLSFTFSKPSISVTMDELVIAVDGSNGEPLTFSDGVEACIFGIAPAGDSTAVLGDTFLRSAYLVYDIANNEISIAQTDFNATGTTVVEIGTGTTSVPDASVVADPVTAVDDSSASSDTVTGTTSTSKAWAQRTAPPSVLGGMAVVGAGMMFAAL